MFLSIGRLALLRSVSRSAKILRGPTALHNGGCMPLLHQRSSFDPLCNSLCNRTRAIHSSQVAAGVVDSIRSAYDTARGGADEKREKLVFEVQMKLLSDSERAFDANRFLDLLSGMKEATGMSGFREHMPWVQNNPALGELKDQQEIVYAMSPDERRSPSALGIGAVKRISRSTGQSLDAVEAVLQQIRTLRSVQMWVVRRENDGLPLPRNSQELQAMLTAPGSGMSQKPPKGRRRARPGVNQKFLRRGS